MDSDVVVIGAGLIGLALARELRHRGMRVTVFEAGTAGRQASWAGAGMLAAYQTAHPQLRALGIASARLYPTWIAELERETYLSAGYRPSGTLFLATPEHPAPALEGWERLTPAQARESEPEIRAEGEVWRIAGDHTVDNRLLTAALVASVRARGIELREQARVEVVEAIPGGWLVHCGGETHAAAVVVNAAGAWAREVAAPVSAPVRPRKGQMLCLRSAMPLRHAVEAEGVYLVPRAASRILVGATVEDVGFDPEVSESTTAELRRRAGALAPALAEAQLVEEWVGFRPCSDDELPILGPTRCPGYWLATGHYRDGILLAPITAKILGSAITRGHLTPALDLTPFSPLRFDP